MRMVISAAVALAVLAAYVYVIASSTKPGQVDPNALQPDELKALVPIEALPAGLRLVQEDAGRHPWSPGTSDEVAYAAMLFEDDVGNRIAVNITATGTSEARVGLRYARDALCSKMWPNSECDPQYNSHRYVESEPAASVGEKTVASWRATVRATHVRSETFVRAGILVTLSMESSDESFFAYASRLLQGLDARATAFALERGVSVENPDLATR